jgi:regulator of protease activity HflC (stomatin/prohibitin superfamily)
MDLNIILLFALTIIIILLVLSIKIIKQYERGIVLRLGKYNRTLEPGLRFIIPIIEQVIRVDTRVIAIDIPQQEIITKDNIPVKINGVVYVKIVDPKKAVLNVENVFYVVSTYAQTVLRDIISKYELDDILSNRQELSKDIKEIVDKRAEEWGIDIVDLKIQDIEVDEKIKSAIARQAEAEREKRAVIIKANGELEAAKKYIEAANLLGNSKTALYLRTLHFLSDISKDPSQKFLFVPLELLEWLKKEK